MLSAPFLTPAETKIPVILSASVERFGVSCMRDFFDSLLISAMYGHNDIKWQEIDFRL